MNDAVPSPLVPLPDFRDAPILAVDDDPAVRGFIAAGLGQMGFRVEQAPDTAEARRLLRTASFSLILCDYEMPGGSGLELLEHVARVRPDLPFIMLTGYDNIDLARHAITAGALDFLSKPFEIRQLVRLIEQNWARLERDRQRIVQRTGEVLSGTIRALVAAVDAKDPHTASHSERVTQLALLMGDALSLTEEELRLLEFSALLHDVGKIAVPESILTKPGKLTEDEWAVMKEHPVRSAEIVRQVSALSEVATVVRHHHERIDGTGYPDALAGPAIPPLSRLIAVVDAYEAMTSDRAYRRALTPSRARDTIAQNLDRQFDRRMGEVFLSLEGLP